MRKPRHLLLLLLLALQSLAFAASPEPVGLISGAAHRPSAVVPARAFAGSSVEGGFNQAALAASRIRVDVGGGRQLVAERRSETRGRSGDITWTGEFEGFPGSLLNVTFHRGQVYGFMHHGADTWEIESRGGSAVQLFRLDEARLPPEGMPRPTPLGEPDPKSVTSVELRPATAAEPIVQDMLVVYTQQAATAALAAGTAIETRIINAVAAANAAYAASGVNIQMNLVHMAQIAYTETGDMGTSLSHVRGTTDGFMDDVHALRDRHGADFVALITNESNYCGIAYVNSSASTAFSVTWWNCFAGQTFAHEVGHNQGNSHDRANGSGGAYPYSFGYRTCDHPALANGQSFRTVMAYSCTGTPRVNFFSNLNVLYNNVAQMGIAYEVDPANSADNTRSMNNTAATQANFRGTGGITPPATPGSLAGTASSGSRIDLTWTDNATDETGYRVERASAGGAYALVATLAANVTSYSNTGLTSNTTYSYRVRAFNGSGFSSWSNVAIVTTPAVAPPAAPTNLAGTVVSSSQINLTWTDNATDEANFVVERSTDAVNFATVATLGANVTSYSNTGLAAGTTYSYRVRATNASGSSASSNTVQVTTQSPPPPPAAPGSPTVTLSGRTATLQWTDVTGETSYQLVREVLNTKNNTWSATTTTLAANTTSRSEGLSRGKTYRYKIRAVNAAGSSAYASLSCTSIAGCTNTAEFRVP